MCSRICGKPQIQTGCRMPEHIEKARLKNNAIGCVPEFAASRKFKQDVILFGCYSHKHKII
jgi:hypothetical protein